MKPRNYLLIVLIFLVLVVLVVLTYAVPGKIFIKVIKDVAITTTLTVSVSLSFKLHISYKKYETDIKSIIIQNQNIYLSDKNDARTNFLLDKDNVIIQELIDAFRPLEWHFKNYDFSSPHRGELFTNLMNLCSGEFDDSTYRFSDSELNEVLEMLKKLSNEFIFFMSMNIFPKANNLFVTKYCDKRKEGYCEADIKVYKQIDDEMYKLVKELIEVYKKIIDMFYEKYTSSQL